MRKRVWLKERLIMWYASILSGVESMCVLTSSTDSKSRGAGKYELGWEIFNCSKIHTLRSEVQKGTWTVGIHQEMVDETLKKNIGICDAVVINSKWWKSTDIFPLYIFQLRTVEQKSTPFRFGNVVILLWHYEMRSNGCMTTTCCAWVALEIFRALERRRLECFWCVTRFYGVDMDGICEYLCFPSMFQDNPEKSELDHALWISTGQTEPTYCSLNRNGNSVRDRRSPATERHSWTIGWLSR